MRWCDLRSNFNGGERILKRKYSASDDSDEWTEHEAKIKRLESPAVAYRSSLTLSNVSCLFDPLVLCFKYLTVKELLRVSLTCKYLNVLASDSRLVSVADPSYRRYDYRTGIGTFRTY